MEQKDQIIYFPSIIKMIPSSIKLKLALITLVTLFINGFPLTAKAQEASFYLSPSGGSYDVGQTFSVNVFVNSEGAAINAAEAKVYFPTDKLKVIGLSKSNSIFSLWIKEPVYSNVNGIISFGGGLPNPGFRGSAGKVITISFLGKASGQAKVYFEGEVILANDPWGTNLFSYSSGGSYAIGVPEELPPETPSKIPPAPKVSSPAHPQSDKWYSNNNPEFQWVLTSDIIGVSTAFNQKLITDPGNTSEGIFTSRIFAGVEDGIWYFHIKAQNSIGWGYVAHFRIQIDTLSPHPFEITIDNEGDATNPRPLLYFDAKDDTSGINHYEIKIGRGEVFSIVEVQSNPFRSPHQAPGTHSLEIRAVDKAGNKTLATSEMKVESIPVPEITVCQEVFLSGEEALFIQGSAQPNIEVLLFFEKDEELIKEWHVFSNEEGSWSLREEDLFKSGIYIIVARAKDARGTISNPSKECVVRVILQGISIGPWIISYRILTIILIILFLIGLIVLIYLVKRIRKTRESIERESKDLKEKFYKEYKELQEDIEEQLGALRKAQSYRRLTGKEKEREERLLRNLSDIERVIKEELKDIEEID
jgi:uncharacterized membrane-anchored protein YhcB (DUF1043 family)